jgi:enterochelin esterase-like enzyme
MDHGAVCRESELCFGLPDPHRDLSGVRLQQRIGLKPDEFDYDEAAHAWKLRVTRPAAWRVEYLLELRRPGGETELICDPHNPRRVPGAFGDKSVLECSEYREPAWLRAPAAPGHWQERTFSAPAMQIEARIWTPDRPTNLVLVAHDGPEFDKLAALGQFSAATIAAGRAPAHQLMLLAPGHRDDWYSANPVYTEALVNHVLPRDKTVVGMGASLGALAMLHAHLSHPGAFAGLFLQSGSFFLPRFDSMERRFSQYRRIIRFVGTAIRTVAPSIPTVLTCGIVEENVHNNRHMACVLNAPLFEVPDGHNFTAWRDALDPHLTDLLRQFDA